MSMIDIHTHILPGFDDGARDWDAAVEMARGAVADGIGSLVATPHIYEGLEFISPRTILDKTAEFQKILEQRGIPLRVFPGSEVHLALDTPDQLRAGNLLTIADNHRYLLVEMPFGALPRYTDEVLFQLQLDGVTPVIAHPERNEEFRKNPDRLVALIRKGCLAQVTGGSLRGNFGRNVEHSARQMVTSHLVQIIASDGHAPDRRRIRMASARELAGRLVGEPEATAMTVSRPNLIVKGANPDELALQPVKKLSYLQTVVGMRLG